MTVRAQALFLHRRLVETALSDALRGELLAELERASRAGPPVDVRQTVSYERMVALLVRDARELSVAILGGDLSSGELVTLTQDFYIRRMSPDRGRVRARLDSNRTLIVEGRFSTEHLVGSTGQTEIFGHHRFTMLAYVSEVDLTKTPPTVEVRPVFVGWRLRASVPGLPPVLDDRREVWPQQVDQFERIRGLQVQRRDLEVVAKLPEEAVKRSFAEIIGEPFIPADWGGEASDLFTNRLTMDSQPVAAAFAFKGPGQPGRLYVAGMGKRGDQALRLAREPADLLVVQHHNAIDAAVRNLLSAVARQHGKRFMTIDGATTAVILRAYEQMP